MSPHGRLRGVRGAGRGSGEAGAEPAGLTAAAKPPACASGPPGAPRGFPRSAGRGAPGSAQGAIAAAGQKPAGLGSTPGQRRPPRALPPTWGSSRRLALTRGRGRVAAPLLPAEPAPAGPWSLELGFLDVRPKGIAGPPLFSGSLSFSGRGVLAHVLDRLLLVPARLWGVCRARRCGSCIAPRGPA